MEKINIVGGGLVGSLMSIYLAKLGYDVDVYERRRDMRHTDASEGRSINLALSDRGWKALEEIGIAAKVREMSIPMHGRMIHNEDGSTVFQPYGQEGQAIYSVSRQGLNNALDNHSISHPNVNYYYQHQLIDAHLGKHEFYFKHSETGEEKTIDKGVVLGTDGAFSAVRWEMMKTPLFNFSQEYLAHAYKELNIPAGSNGDWQLDKNALHIWPRRSFMLIALPNLDGSFTCTLFLAFKGEESFEQLTDATAIQSFFETEFPDALALMPTLLQDFEDNPTSSLITIKCFPWSVGHQLCLMGDASHAIVPFYGQGMNSGFEDCRVLNGIIQQHIEGGVTATEWAQIFSTFEQTRKPDADAISDLAMRNFIEMRDSVADAPFLLRKKIEKHLQRTYPDKFIPTYSMVTFRPDIRYSEALRLANEQNKLFEKIMQLPDIENNWDTPELHQIVEQYFSENL